MFKKLSIIALFALAYIGFLLYPKQLASVESQTLPPAETGKPTWNFANLTFPATRSDYAAPAWWKGQVFEMSANYPTIEPPVCPVETCRWKTINFETKPEEYLRAVLDYSVEGNTEVDWAVKKNKKRNWYHAPFMHPTTFGREFIHGLTRERKACLDELKGEECKTPCSEKFDSPGCFQTWAVSVYNEPGAYYIGKVWNEVAKLPADRNLEIFFDRFPEDTVTVKLLFTKASPEQVPYLQGSQEWQADTKRIKKKKKKESDCVPLTKCVETLRLLQVDVAVRDKKSPIGWVFGTFIYNKNSTKNYPLGVEPIGLMFGNDIEPHQSWLNTSLSIKQHYGCPKTGQEHRLNGPVDNPKSSCTSCHSLAETPASLGIESIPYKTMNCEEEKKWFRNINPESAVKSEKTFNENMFSLDYSLQLREGIMRYCDENKAKCGL